MPCLIFSGLDVAKCYEHHDNQFIVLVSPCVLVYMQDYITLALVRMGFALAHSRALVNPLSCVKPACSNLVSCFRSVEFIACLLCLY